MSEMSDALKCFTDGPDQKKIIEDARSLLYALASNVDVLHYGCAYCGNPNIYAASIVKRRDDEGSRLVSVVVKCDSCSNEDWISVNSRNLAKIAMFL